jgi:PEP-CTERM motif
MRRGLSWVLLILVCLVFAALPASASVTTYTDSASFQTAIAGLSSSTVNFDGNPTGVIAQGTTIGGITFTSTFLVPGEDLAIQSTFDTTSSPNYLGTTDPGTQAFYGGETLTMSFNPVSALGMFIISDATPNASDFSLITSSGTAFNAATPVLTLADGGQVIYLGLTSSSTFSSATLTLNSSAGYQWNADDITIASQPLAPTPEPGTFMLLGSGFLLLFRRLRKAV